MNATTPHQIMQRWNTVQFQLLPDLLSDSDVLTPTLEKLIHTLEWARIEEFVCASRTAIGRIPHERSWIANAFIAKAVLGLTTTVHLIERLTIDRTLRRICGFPCHKKLPSESTFSRAFDELAEAKLAERAHDAFVKAHFADRLIGHINRDGTAIEARERPVKKPKESEKGKPKRGRPCKGQEPVPKLNIARQRSQSLDEMLSEIPKQCSRGAKSNAQGYKNSWNGYKLHLDIADCGVPISALLSSASMHDSRAAIPLSYLSNDRVTNLYDLMDAAYCSQELQEHCRSLGHVPLIDHNARGGIKEEFEPADKVRYRERSAAERANARLKDEFGGRNIWVRGPTKVMSHLMFGILALSVDQLLRLRR
ncbi:transposase [Vibrio parahaemolyticus]|uniref:transposase n=1 Tax=Gammaproteobacteria TaxID=1236 RepID=UPI001869ECDE|nr:MULTISPECIES: transposase [Gammaproteobacteria]MBE4272513.1 transposase [Vibrio parahaemolyticus]MBE4277354.1 transposase [Vibrio parahaemolyticus]MCA0775603.1 transposase [Vibrio vulnificus]MDE3273163.1 transposase [Pseudoalteromonas sp. G4]MDF5188451.1 transposase [Vibrio parahaemolyticus]